MIRRIPEIFDAINITEVGKLRWRNPGAITPEPVFLVLQINWTHSESEITLHQLWNCLQHGPPAMSYMNQFTLSNIFHVSVNQDWYEVDTMGFLLVAWDELHIQRVLCYKGVHMTFENEIYNILINKKLIKKLHLEDFILFIPLWCMWNCLSTHDWKDLGVINLSANIKHPLQLDKEKRLT